MFCFIKDIKYILFIFANHFKDKPQCFHQLSLYMKNSALSIKTNICLFAFTHKTDFFWEYSTEFTYGTILHRLSIKIFMRSHLRNHVVPANNWYEAILVRVYLTSRMSGIWFCLLTKNWTMPRCVSRRS